MSWPLIEHERRHADPAYAPDWVAEDRPKWTPDNERGKLAFAKWASAQLDELERRVRAERIAELEAEMTPERLQLMHQALRGGLPKLGEKVEALRLAKANITVNEIVEMEERQAVRKASGWTGGAGRPASGADPHSPAAKAARDLWRLRHVILPRFWPTAGRGGVGPRNDALADIAATRHHGAKSSAVFAWYENERLASK